MQASRTPIGILSIVLATWAHGADLSGHVALKERNGKPLAPRDVRNTVVYFRPDRTSSVRLDARTFVLETEDKEFRPRVLPITVGSTVRFPNGDPILHNVFSVSPGNSFDLGLYGAGEGLARAFDSPGLVRVFCNVHHSMVAYLLVLDTPHFTRPEADGRFRLQGLPEGPGTLTVWHERATPWTREVELPEDDPLTVSIAVTQRRVPRHLNKLGQPYRRNRRDGYE